MLRRAPSARLPAARLCGLLTTLTLSSYAQEQQPATDMPPKDSAAPIGRIPQNRPPEVLPIEGPPPNAAEPPVGFYDDPFEPEDAEPPRKRLWYGWQTLLIDLPAVALGCLSQNHANS